MKTIGIVEAAEAIGVSTGTLYVSAHAYKKKNGEYPYWYKSEGKQCKTVYVDISALIDIQDENRKLYNESCDMYYVLNDFGYHDALLGRIIASKSEIFTSPNAWQTFLKRDLFTEPRVRYFQSVSKRTEFHRIAKEMIDDIQFDGFI